MSSTELVLIDDALKAADVFKPGAVAKLLADVEAKVRAIPPSDHTTEKGRNEIKALAYKVTRSKTALDGLGKTHVEELKKAAGVVDADRRIIRERLDALRDEVRKPVTDYEAAEEKRIDAHKANMEMLQTLDVFTAEQYTVDEIDARLLTLSALKELKWEEFSDGANRLIAKMGTSLAELRAKAVVIAGEKAELERLRKADADRQEADRKAQAEQAQRDRDREISERAVRDTEIRNAAVAAAKEQDRQLAVWRADKAERNAENASQMAIELERKRVADAKAAEDAETKRREEDKAHIAKVCREALADLMKIPSVTDKIGRAIVVAIAKRQVANVRIEY